MEQSSTSQAFHWMSRSEYLSTLPLWRRCLAMLNWRPVFEIEQETARLRQEKENLKQEIERLRKGNERLDAVLQYSDSNSQTPPSTDSD